MMPFVCKHIVFHDWIIVNQRGSATLVLNNQLVLPSCGLFSVTFILVTDNVGLLFISTVQTNTDYTRTKIKTTKTHKSGEL